MFLFLLLRCNVSLTVKVVQYGEVFDQLFDVRTKVASTGGAGKDIARAQVHETMLTKSVTTGQDARDLILVAVLVEANGTCYFHSVVFVGVHLF